MGEVVTFGGGREVYQPRPIIVYEEGACSEAFVDGVLYNRGRVIKNIEDPAGFVRNELSGFDGFSPEFHDVINDPKPLANQDQNTPVGVTFLAGLLHGAPVGFIAREQAFYGQMLIDTIRNLSNDKVPLLDMSLVVALYDKSQEPASEAARLLYTHARDRLRFLRNIEFHGNAFEETGFEFALSAGGLLVAFRHLYDVTDNEAGKSFVEMVSTNREQVLEHAVSTQTPLPPDGCA